jgi:hypothetical protein
MGARYTLKNNGYAWLTICRGRKQVGRVWQHATTKRWHGMIGRTEATGSTSSEAFQNVAAKQLGFDTPQDVHEHNSRVRRANTERRNQMRRVVNGVLQGDYDALDELLGIPKRK